MKKFYFILSITLFPLLANASVYVRKGRAKITGLLSQVGTDYYIGINVLSRSKHYFVVKNPDSLKALNPSAKITLVDAEFVVRKLVDSQHSEVEVKRIAVSAAKSSPSYSEVGRN